MPPQCVGPGEGCVSPSPYHLPTASQPLHDPTDPSLLGPLEGSELSGFGLPAVGSALAACLAGEPPGDQEVLLWTLVCTGWGECPKKIPSNHMECLYRRESGIFAPPAWPHSLPVLQRVIDEDKALKEAQGQWVMAAMAISKGYVRLEKAVLDSTALWTLGILQGLNL